MTAKQISAEMNKSCSKKITKVVSFVKNNSYVLPPGNYFIGDPCYFLNDYIYNNVWANSFECEAGHYSLPDGRGFVIMNLPDMSIVNSDDDKYSIDSGSFGIFSVQLGDKNKFTGDGTFHTFHSPVSFNYKNGFIELHCGSKTLTFESYDCLSDDDGYDSVG